MKFLILCLITFLSFSFSQASEKVIYGDDNRMDWFEVQDKGVKDLALSTVVLVKTSKLTEKEGKVTLKERDSGLCPSEPFYKQKAGGFCSGFLVSEDTIVTAGHCIKSDWDCSNTSFVFSYALETEDSKSNEIKKENIYNCKKLVDREQVSTGADWAVIKLDRKVKNRKPLALRTKGEIKTGEELTLIGHPSGLPSKIAPKAIVRKIKENYLVASTDSYGGNSGSAVFNSTTGEVEGILVRGERDYVYQSGCKVSNKCDEDSCRGEDVTLIKKVLPHL